MNETERNAWWIAYLTAGEAVFTMPSIGNSARHRTYRIRTRPDKQHPRRKIHFVSAKTTDGPDVEWVYVGLYIPGEATVRRTAASGFSPDSDTYQTINYTAFTLANRLPTDITPSGQCAVCRRPLEDPLSVTLGIGPVCRRDMGFDEPRLTRFLGRESE